MTLPSLADFRMARRDCSLGKCRMKAIIIIKATIKATASVNGGAQGSRDRLRVRVRVRVRVRIKNLSLIRQGQGQGHGKSRLWRVQPSERF